MKRSVLHAMHAYSYVSSWICVPFGKTALHLWHVTWNTWRSESFFPSPAFIAENREDLGNKTKLMGTHDWYKNSKTTGLLSFKHFCEQPKNSLFTPFIPVFFGVCVCICHEYWKVLSYLLIKKWVVKDFPQIIWKRLAIQWLWDYHPLSTIIFR